MGRIDGLRKKRSGELARRRLRLLLITDKTGIGQETLDMMKRDMYRVISRYMDVDFEELELVVKSTALREDTDLLPVLYTRIPIKRLNCKGNR